mgnify:CR=1 FL=1
MTEPAMRTTAGAMPQTYSVANTKASEIETGLPSRRVMTPGRSSLSTTTARLELPTKAVRTSALARAAGAAARLVVVLVIFAFQAFAQVDILTSGGPAGATDTLVWKIFNSQDPAKQGQGAMMAIGLFGVRLVVSLGQFLLLDRRVHYGR